MDQHHHLSREAPDCVLDPQIIEEVHKHAANSAEAIAMLDRVQEKKLPQKKEGLNFHGLYID